MHGFSIIHILPHASCILVKRAKQAYARETEEVLA